MASVIDIANLALARLGDDATLSSIDPPEGSAQAEHCARFYPLARDTLLGWPDANWNFATKRVALAQVDMAWSTWDFAYTVPNNMLRAISVLAPDAPDDYSTPYALPYSAQGEQYSIGYQPQPFVIEVDGSDRQVIYTNQENATLRYISRVTDPTRFPPTFIDALVWLLASYLAGPMLKGDSGAAAANSAYNAFMGALARATHANAQQRHVKVSQNVAWVTNR